MPQDRVDGPRLWKVHRDILAQPGDGQSHLRRRYGHRSNRNDVDGNITTL
jgi:hypothetical protein